MAAMALARLSAGAGVGRGASDLRSASFGRPILGTPRQPESFIASVAFPKGFEAL